jgi:hypothetical protein
VTSSSPPTAQLFPEQPRSSPDTLERYNLVDDASGSVSSGAPEFRLLLAEELGRRMMLDAITNSEIDDTRKRPPRRGMSITWRATV